MHYQDQPTALHPLVNWMALYATSWPRAFDRLEKLLKEMDQ